MASSAATIMNLVNRIKWLSFKFNNADFPPLLFPSVSKLVSSVSDFCRLLQLASLFPARSILGHPNRLLLLPTHLVLVFLFLAF